ncbi:transmembrane protein, putative [Bodo saltans]|uniref:Transmembrane protein, putative n=1 Tax=Bodo saltans TaxID=75058 RepID=A0A0S4J511_BODSA|nr:transmembrane protein, putative [Bodo saltans]|eukprot:CUG84384.1 transmembrane protein, putative [Bodo saltans]
MNPLTTSGAPQPPQSETLMNFAIPSSDSEDEFIFGRNDEKQAEAEMLSEYTDEDSLHSSGDEMLPVDHRQAQRDAQRSTRVVSVHATMERMESDKMKRILQDTVEEGPTSTAAVVGIDSNTAHYSGGRGQSGDGWVHEIPISAVALQSSSFFVIPPRQTLRVVLYNLIHHWLFEVYLILLIVGYAIFQACWVRSGKEFQRPPFALWVDVFYFILGGLNLNDQEGFGNYTSIRLLRVIRSCALIKRPVSMKLFARTFLRSSRAVLHVLAILAIVFFLSRRYHSRRVELERPRGVWQLHVDSPAPSDQVVRTYQAPRFMKLFARTFLRSSRAVLHVLAILAIGLLFFALLGTQIFAGALRFHCVQVFPNGTTLVDYPEQLCSPEATFWENTTTPTGTLWGHACPATHECVASSRSPNLDYFHFDNIGFALLATFQISTNQGWSFMLRGTNDTVNVVSFLWYMTLIICLSWFLPGLILGIFMERADKTRGEYVAAQIKKYDEMCRERRFDAIRAAPISSRVAPTEDAEEGSDEQQNAIERGEGGQPTDDAKTQISASGSSNNRANSDGISRTSRKLTSAASHRKSGESNSESGFNEAKDWSSEMRLQLHLSLTRNRGIAETAEASKSANKRASSASSSNRQAGGSRIHQSSVSNSSSRPGTAQSRAESHSQLRTGSAPARGVHDSSYHRRSSGSEFAFLDPDVRRRELEARQSHVSASRGATPEAARPSTGHSLFAVERLGGNSLVTSPVAREQSRPASGSTAPPSLRNPEHASVERKDEFDALGALGTEPNTSGIVRPGTAGSVKSRNGGGRYGQQDTFSVSEADPVKPQRASVGAGELPSADQIEDEDLPAPPAAPVAPPIEAPEGFEVIVVPDPEGGDLTDATTCKRAWESMRCIVHMFTEGYPRIVGQYLHDCRIAKNHGRTLDFGFQSIHEVELEDAMRAHKKKQNRSRQQQSINNEDAMFDDFEDEQQLKLTPHRMAQSIADNVEPTWYNYVLVAVLLMNSVVLATYHYPQSSKWDTAQWVIHFAANLFYLSEVLLRLFALGFEIYCSSVMNLTDAAVVIVGFVELALNRTNVITCLRLYRMMSFFKKVRFLRSLRKVSRVLWLCVTDLFNLMMFLFVYVLLVVLYGMSLFGGAWTVGSALNNTQLELDIGSTQFQVPTAMISTQITPFNTRGNFNTFSDAVFVAMQAFSRVRDDWLLVTWSAMSQKGDYALLYFLVSVMAASYIFQTLFIAILAEGFEKDDAHDSEDDDDEASLRAGSRNRFFDFSLLSLLQRKTGGFARRKVTPNRVFELRTDMKHRLRTAHHDWDRYVLDTTAVAATPLGTEHHGRAPILGMRDSAFYGSSSSIVVDTQQTPVMTNPSTTSFSSQQIPFMLGGGGGARLSSMYDRHEHVPVDGFFGQPMVMTSQGGALVTTTTTTTTSAGQHDDNADVQAMIIRLTQHRDRLVMGPSYRVARRWEGGEWVPDRCDRCGDAKQAPLKAPANTQQKTVEDIHQAQCDACSVRMAKLEVLTTILDYVRLQQQLNILPTLHCMETLLGQAWSCGLLLSESVEELCAVDPITECRSWQKLLRCIDTQLWLLDLRTGQEQIGKFTNAYLLAYRREEAELLDDSSPKSFFLFHRGQWFRSTILDVVSTRWFQYISMGVIVLAAAMLACVDVLQPASSDRNHPFTVLDDIFTVWMTIEMLLKWIAMGVVHPYPTAYFYSVWNLYDAFAVSVSIASWASESVGLRYLKVFRLLRLFEFLPSAMPFLFRSVRVLCAAVQDASRSFISVGVFAALNYFVWASFALHIMGGTTHTCTDKNRTTDSGCVGYYNLTLSNGTKIPVVRTWYAPRNFTYSFDSFDEALLVMVEVSTGSSWMDVLYAAADSVSEGVAPIAGHRPFLGLFFVAFYFISGFVVLGLIAALTVYSYVKTKTLFDGAVYANPQQQLWSRIQAYLLENFRPNVPLRPLNNPLSELLHALVMSRGAELFMSLIVVGHIITMSVVTYGASDRNDHLQKVEYFWVALFIAETTFRLIAHGPRTLRRHAHALDALTVVLSILQLGLNSTSHHRIPFNVNTFRMLRIFRVAHAVRFIPQARRLNLYGQTLMNILPAFGVVTLVLALCVFIFAVVGMHVLALCVFIFAVVGMHAFGGIPTRETSVFAQFLDADYNNYNTFVNSLLLTFRVVTFESWNKVLRDTLPRPDCVTGGGVATCGTNWAALYFIVLVLFVGIVIVALYMGVVVEGYVTTLQMENSLHRIRDLHRFSELWEEKDPDGTMTIPTNDLHGIFRKLGAPLGIVNEWDRVEMIHLCKEYNIADHHGRVHFHEVLLPMARRLLAWHLEVDPSSIGMGGANGGAGPLLVTKLDVVRFRNSPTTAEHYFAATYALAAYRRKQAMRAAHKIRKARWDEGRRYCDAHELSYQGYGFQGYPLDVPFPEYPRIPLILQHQQRDTLKGLQLPEEPQRNAAVVVDQEDSMRSVRSPTSSLTQGAAAVAGGVGSSNKRPPRPTSALPVPPVKSVAPAAAASLRPTRPMTSPATGRKTVAMVTTPVATPHERHLPSPRVSDPHRLSLSAGSHHPQAQHPSQKIDIVVTNGHDQFDTLPSYSSAIDDGTSRFGPSVPEAIHRNERRGSRLLRKQQQRLSSAAATSSAAAAASASVGAASLSPPNEESVERYQLPLGSEPNSWRTHESERRDRRRSTSAGRGYTGL